MLTILLILLFIFIFFNGVFTRIFLEIGLLELKSFVPEIIILLVVLIIIIKDIFIRKKISNIFNLSLIFSMLILIKLLLDMAEGITLIQIVYIFRDLMLPFLLFYLYINSHLFYINSKIIIEKMVKVSKCFLILGLILGILQVVLGWEFTSKLYTGYAFFGDDIETGIRIYTNNGGLLRIPSLTGSFTLFGIMNLFAIFFIYLTKTKHKERYFVAALINCILTTSRTSMLMIIIFFVLNIPLKKIVKFLRIIIIIVPPIIILLATKMKSIFSIESLLIRIEEVWPMLLSQFKNISNLIFGGNLYDYGTVSALAESQIDLFGYNRWVDNTYLYLFLTLGILGVTLYLMLVGDCYMKSVKETRALIISISVGAIFASFFTGRVMIVFYLCIALSYHYSLNISEEVI